MGEKNQKGPKWVPKLGPRWSMMGLLAHHRDHLGPIFKPWMGAGWSMMGLLAHPYDHLGPIFGPWMGPRWSMMGLDGPSWAKKTKDGRKRRKTVLGYHRCPSTPIFGRVFGHPRFLVVIYDQMKGGRMNYRTVCIAAHIYCQ